MWPDATLINDSEVPELLSELTRQQEVFVAEDR